MVLYLPGKMMHDVSDIRHARAIHYLQGSADVSTTGLVRWLYTSIITLAQYNTQDAHASHDAHTY